MSRLVIGLLMFFLLATLFQERSKLSTGFVRWSGNN